MTKLVYKYDKDTKEYKYYLRAQKNSAGNYILPPNSTFIEPMGNVEGKVRVFEEGEEEGWALQDDFRGQLQINLETKVLSTVQYIGAIPEGYMLYSDYQNTEAYREEMRQAEERKKAWLSLTPREVFLALYKDKGITPEQVRAQLTDPQDLIEFDHATEYLRGNPLIDKIGEKLGYTSAQLNYLFEHKELPEVENGIFG